MTNTQPHTSITGLLDLIRTPKASSISHMLTVVSDHQGYEWFIQMVEAILPEQSQQILSEPEHSTMIRTFIRIFQEEYFPLLDHIVEDIADRADGNDFMNQEVWDELAMEVPIDLEGFLIEDEDEIINLLRGNGARMEMAIIPILLPITEILYTHDQHIRLSWLDAAAEVLPPDSVAKIPLEGFPLNTILQTFQKNGLEDLYNLAIWTARQTPYELINIQYSPDEFIQPNISWTREDIQDIAEEWRRARPIMQSVWRALDWLGKDRTTRFQHIVNLIEKEHKTLEKENAEHANHTTESPNSPYAIAPMGPAT